MIVWGDCSSLWWLVPALLMALLWIKTPIFVSAAGKRILLFLKLSILSLFILAMLDPKVPTQTVQETFKVVFVVDNSPSIEPQEREAALSAVASACGGLSSNVEPSVVLFSGTAVSLDKPQLSFLKSKSLDEIRGLLGQSKRDNNSDIGGALLESLKQIPTGQRGKIILYSDGLDTHGDIGKALEVISDSNIPVNTLPLSPTKITDTPRVIRAVFPEQAYVGEEITANLLIHQPSSGEVDIEIAGTDGSSYKRRIFLETGLNAQTFPFRPGKIGPLVYTSKAAPSQSVGMGAQTWSNVKVRPLPKVMIFQDNQAEGKFLQEALRSEKIEFIAFEPGSWPKNLKEEIKQYPCIVLNNIHKSAFQDDDLKAVRERVKDGGGLMMLGGERSYGLGDYTDTPIEEALPVRMPRRTINQPLALVLVLDASGSMFGEPWEYLLQATKEIVRLCKGHHVGIIMFNHFPTWVSPIHQIDDPEAVCRVIDQCDCGGGTVFSLPLVQALIALKDQPFTQKCVLMMSDGVPADFPHVKPLFENFREYGITVTTIAAGRDVNAQNLEIIAAETNGQFYQSLDFSELPNLFKKEIKRISGPPYIEEDFKPIIVDARSLARGIAQEEIPYLKGLIVTQKKDQATTIMTSNRGDPVMAYWRYGLGRGVAFTSDMLPNWSSQWARWDGFGKLLRQTVKALCEGAQDKFSVFLTQKGTFVNVVVDPGPDNRLAFRYLDLTDSGGKKKALPLSMLPDGRYEGSFDSPNPGFFYCKAVGEGQTEIAESIFGVNESSEFRPSKTNEMLLKHIAEKTGGEYADSLSGFPSFSFGEAGETTLYFSLWPWLVIFAMILYILDIYLRKANIFGITNRASVIEGEAQGDEIYLQLAQKFSSMAEEHSLKGDVAEAKRYYLRAKAFFMKAQASKEANLMWERYKRFEGR